MSSYQSLSAHIKPVRYHWYEIDHKDNISIITAITASISDIIQTSTTASLSDPSVSISVSRISHEYHLVSLNHNDKVHINISISPNLWYLHYHQTSKSSDWGSQYHRSRPKNTTWPQQSYHQTQVPTGDVITIIIHSRHFALTRSQLSTWVIKHKNPSALVTVFTLRVG